MTCPQTLAENHKKLMETGAALQGAGCTTCGSDISHATELSTQAVSAAIPQKEESHSCCH